MECAFALVDAGGGTRASPKHRPFFIGLEKEREIYVKTGSEGFAFIISSDTNPQRREYTGVAGIRPICSSLPTPVSGLQAGHTGTKAFQGETQGLWKEAFIPKPLSES
jgi:hypothetical protein